MANLEQFGKAFFPEQPSTVSTAYGTVQSVNADGSYQVKLNASGNTRCARLCNAAAGDAVFVVIQENGKCAVIGRRGGSISLPTGGSSGQVLAKASATDYDVEWVNQSGGGGGTDDYNELINKPTITEPVYGSDPVQYSTVTIRGDKTFDELGMHPLSNSEINDLIAVANSIQGV